MNEVQIFSHPDFGRVRTVEIDGEPWLVGKDVAIALGYSNPQKAIRDHVDADDRGVNESFTVNGTMATLINESGLYSLVLSSKLPTARKFRHWVTSEVLPAIRKQGVYVAPEVDSSMLYKIAMAMEEKEKQIQVLTAENEQQRQALADFEPKIQYLDTILDSPGTLTTTQIAADYGLSATKLNRILHEESLQHNVNGQWILYHKYMGQGLTKSKTFQFERSDGRPDAKMTTQWTQKGRLLIHNILTDRGIVAEMDRD